MTDLRLGSTTPSALYVGSSAASKVYLGATQVWSAFDVLADIAWHSAFWLEDPDWTAPSDGGAVVSLRNAGTEAKDATTGGTITYDADGIGGRPAVQGDGTSGYLATTAFDAALTQPFTICGVLTLTASSNAYAWGGLNLTNRADFARAQITTNDRWLAVGGSILNAGVGTGDAAPHFFEVYYNGASSQIRVDGTVMNTGNAGTHTLTGLTLMAYNGGSLQNGGRGSFWGLFDGDLAADGQYANLKAWVADHYGLTVA